MKLVPQVVVNQSKWMLGNEPRSTARTVCVLNCRAIPPANSGSVYSNRRKKVFSQHFSNLLVGESKAKGPVGTGLRCCGLTFLALGRCKLGGCPYIPNDAPQSQRAGRSHTKVGWKWLLRD